MSYRSIIESLESRRLLAGISGGATSLLIGDTLYYAYDDNVHGQELWKSNADGSNAQLVKDLYTGLPGHGSSPRWFTNVNGTLLFTCYSDYAFGHELWRSDGTEQGTVLVKDIYVGASPSNPRDFMMVNGRLIFVADPSYNTSLYVTDGTSAGTVRLVNQYDRVDPESFELTPNLLRFDVLRYPKNVRERWETDGTVEGTRLAPPISHPVPKPYSISLTDGILRIRGSDAAERYILARGLADPSILKIQIGDDINVVPFIDVQQIILDARGGNDRIELHRIAIPSKVYGGTGNDTIYGTQAADRIYAGDGDDWISAGAGNDVVYGEAGDDRIFGGAGRDYLVGGTGRNLIRGEGGVDQIFATKLLDDVRGNREDMLNLISAI